MDQRRAERRNPNREKSIALDPLGQAPRYESARYGGIGGQAEASDDGPNRRRDTGDPGRRAPLETQGQMNSMLEIL